jgi:hypothetical protein
MAPPSKTDIINLALGHLKQRKIASLSEVSVQASEALRCYETARRETLRGDWSFNSVVKDLALNADYEASATGIYAGKWLYAYVYPANALGVWKVFNEGTVNQDKGEEFRVVYDDVHNTKVILTNLQYAMVEYGFDVQDVTMFDSAFITAFSVRLAYEMAPNLTGDDSVVDSMFKLYTSLMSDAERIDSYESSSDTYTGTTSPYEESR